MRRNGPARGGGNHVVDEGQRPPVCWAMDDVVGLVALLSLLVVPPARMGRWRCNAAGDTGLCGAGRAAAAVGLGCG